MMVDTTVPVIVLSHKRYTGDMWNIFGLGLGDNAQVQHIERC